MLSHLLIMFQGQKQCQWILWCVLSRRLIQMKLGLELNKCYKISVVWRLVAPSQFEKSSLWKTENCLLVAFWFTAPWIPKITFTKISIFFHLVRFFLGYLCSFVSVCLVSDPWLHCIVFVTRVQFDVCVEQSLLEFCTTRCLHFFLLYSISRSLYFPLLLIDYCHLPFLVSGNLQLLVRRLTLWEYLYE